MSYFLRLKASYPVVGILAGPWLHQSMRLLTNTKLPRLLGRDNQPGYNTKAQVFAGEHYGG